MSCYTLKQRLKETFFPCCTIYLVTFLMETSTVSHTQSHTHTRYVSHTDIHHGQIKLITSYGKCSSIKCQVFLPVFKHNVSSIAHTHIKTDYPQIDFSNVFTLKKKIQPHSKSTCIFPLQNLISSCDLIIIYKHLLQWDINTMQVIEIYRNQSGFIQCSQ